jgi:hypothetical protein
MTTSVYTIQYPESTFVAACYSPGQVEPSEWVPRETARTSGVAPVDAS